VLLDVARFELRFQIRSPLFWISSGIFFLLSFLSVVVEGVQIGGRGNVHVNAPFAIALTLGVMSVFAVFVVVAIVAGAVVRDDETEFAPILHTTRITKPAYVFGRFSGAVVAGFLVLVAVALGVLVGTEVAALLHTVDPQKIGPFRAFDYLWVLGVFTLPTLLVVSAGFFALATGTRSMTATYVGAVAVLALYFVALALTNDPQYERIVALLDPFALGPLDLATRYWTVAEKNSRVPELSGLVLRNRLLWSAVAAALFALGYRAFRFGTPPARARRASAADEEAPAAASLGHRVAPAFGRGTGVAQLLAIARFEANAILRSPAFYVLLVLGVLNSFGALWSATEFRGAEIHPVTRAMVRVLDGTFTLFPLVIAVFYAGELTWRDRDRRVHEITGATPAPDWTFLVPRVAAVVAVLAATVVVGIATAVLVQALKGWTRFEIGHYLLWFGVPTLVTLAQVAVLAVFVQLVVPHKAVGWAVMIVYFVATLSLAGAGFEHPLYRHAATPPQPLSDMNGLGRFWVGVAWLQAYWTAFSVLLVALALAMGRRGAEQAFLPRLRALPSRLRGANGLVAALSAAAFAAAGAWIFFNTNVLSEYVPSREADRRLAEVERRLRPFENVPQPTVTDVKLDVQVYPRQVRVKTRGEYEVENRTRAPLSEVHLRWNLRTRMDELAVEGGTTKEDLPEVHYRIFALDPPMAAGERRRITFATTLEERGFPAVSPLTRVVANGTFVDNTEISPYLGFWMGEDVLQDRAKRFRYGLGDLPRMAKLEDERARAHHYLRHDSDWVNADLTVTTDADQVPVAPGYQVEARVTGGRRTVHTRTDAPIHHFFSIQSARYAVRSEQVGPVATTVLYHPDHAYNVERMLAAMRRSLEIFQREFSPFQFRQLRILEFPAYASFAQSFSNTIPFSEAIGFVADPSNPEKVDLATYVTAHEVAHQWFAHQIVGADAQGATVLSETFAQYGALLVMESLYGKAQVRQFLKYELDQYLRSRGGELVEELPLARVENQGYIHYQKGILVMAWLREVVGEAPVNRAIRRLVERYAFQAAPYPTSADFLALLREEAPGHEKLVEDLFEKITLYDLKARSATVTRRADGKFDVALEVEATKKYADGEGRETEAPMDEVVEVGAFDAEPGKKDFSEKSVLALEKRRIVSGVQTLMLVTDREPRLAGIDPFNKRIDRNSDDNLVKPGS